MTGDASLESLYPFLHGGKRDTRLLPGILLDSVESKARESSEVKLRFFAENSERVVRIAALLADVYSADGRLFCMGNGGSSCDAAHIAVEFLHPVTAGRPALPAINLTSDVAMLTAVANDVGVKHVFVRQLIALARRGDAVIGVSTSGNSDNLLAAFAEAKRLGLKTIGLSGMDGGRMAASRDLDECLIVRSDSIHRVQETHVAIYHILWDLVHTLLADSRGATRDVPP
jgi:D-sedoheptulose 7-phosphate isomerase